MWKKENLRKNFLRVKQMADQNLGRAEKSEVLSQDQQGSERRVEIVRQVSNNLIKKVTALLEAPPGTDAEKRLKKLPETSLSHTFIESALLLGTESLLGAICQQCGECESTLAQAELQCELNIEKEVLTPLHNIAEVDIPSILKHRKHLNKSTLDMDSAKSRHHSALRQSQVPGANLASAAAKADAVREEYDDACNKVETIKDNLSIELCNFIAKESEHSSRIVALLESQKAYHEKALKTIEETIPKMKQTIDLYPVKPMFGMSLEDHLRMMGRDVSQVLEDCILTLLDTGMEEEGLFRIAGSALKLKKLKACFDAHAQDMDEFSSDPHTVAGVLKQYLRELPEPLLTFDLCHEFMHATQLPQDQRLKSLQATVNKLPPANYNNLRYLVKFLALLAEKSQVNKMTPSNIAIVMGPNLLWARGETAPNMMTAGAVSAIIEALIIHAEFFFPGELDFHLTGRGCAPPSPSIANPSTKETPMMTISDTQAEPDAAVMEKGSELKTMILGTGDNTPVQSSTPEAAENLSQQDSASLDHGSESSGEVVIGGVGPDMDFPESGPYSPDSPGHELRPDVPVNVMSASSPSVVTYSPAPNASHSSLNSATPASNSISPTTDSPEGPQLSPKIQRRQTKKPAPPPPPDRGYAVAVTASVSKGTGNGGMTWPRNAPASSPEASSDHGPEGEKRHSPPERRTSGHDRPHGPPPERPSGPPPERPKVPPPLPSGAQQPPGGGAPGGHQRSSSAGAMYITTTAGPNAGSASHESLQAGMGTTLTTGQGHPIPSGTLTLGRHSSMRPARPIPPPPPPPVNLDTEETHL